MPMIGKNAVKTSTSIDDRHHPVEHARDEVVPRDLAPAALAARASMRSTSAASRLSWRENSM